MKEGVANTTIVGFCPRPRRTPVGVVALWTHGSYCSKSDPFPTLFMLQLPINLPYKQAVSLCLLLQRSENVGESFHRQKNNHSRSKQLG